MSDTKTSAARPLRGLLIWSLALNLFLICGLGAYLASTALQKPAALGKGGPAIQFEALAAQLPAGDAGVLRAEFKARSEAIDEAHTALHRFQDGIRAALRAEPYDAGATQQAMAEAEAAHGRLEKLLQDVIASAAGRMSPAGRSKLAEFRPGPPRR